MLRLPATGDRRRATVKGFISRPKLGYIRIPPSLAFLCVNLLKNKRPGLTSRKWWSQAPRVPSPLNPEHLVNILSCSSGVISTPSSGSFGRACPRPPHNWAGDGAEEEFRATRSSWAAFCGSGREWSFGHAANFFHVRSLPLPASSIYRRSGSLLASPPTQHKHTQCTGKN